MAGTPYPHESEIRCSVHHDDGAHPDAASTRKALRQRSKVTVIGRNHAPPPMNAHNPGWSLEGAEHQHDAPVLPQMGDGLYAAAGLVQVGEAAFVQDHQLLTVALR